MTYSIVACAGPHVGVATASHWVAVGALVPWTETGVGAVATQAFTAAEYGTQGLAGLSGGARPQDVVDDLIARDAHSRFRQVAVVDASGHTAHWSGTACFPHTVSAIGDGVVALGNMLANPAVAQDMLSGFERSTGPLADRLLTALAAGEAAGGDARGPQSAALKVVRRTREETQDEIVADIRVDDSPQPIVEARRLLELQGRYNRIAAVAFSPGSCLLTPSAGVDDQQAAAIELATGATRTTEDGREATLWLALVRLHAGDIAGAQAALDVHPELNDTARHWARHLGL